MPALYMCFMIYRPDCTVAHCNHSGVYKYWNGGVSQEFEWHLACETLPFQNLYHVSNRSVQCANGTRNHEITVPSLTLYIQDYNDRNHLEMPTKYD